MKTKKCNYCEEKIEYEEKDITFNKDYGRGIFCNLCGTFIKIEKKVSKSTTSYPRSRSYSRYRPTHSRQRQIRRNKIMIIMAALLFLPFLIWVNTTLWSDMTLPSKQQFSTFQIVCNNTGYDMSDQIPISISVPKHGVEFNDSIDKYTLSNYYLLIDSQFPIDLEVDLRLFEYVMIEINPNYFNPNYTNKLGVYHAGMNYNFQFYASYNVTIFNVPYFSFIGRF